MIFDTIGINPSEGRKLLKKYDNAKCISIVQPFLKNNDELGFPFGLMKTGLTLGLENLQVCISYPITIQFGVTDLSWLRAYTSLHKVILFQFMTFPIKST